MGRAFGKQHKKKAPKYAQVAEQQLSNSYDSGYFDGYHDGLDEAHSTWALEIGNVPKIGVKLKVAILAHMTKVMKQRAYEKGLQKNELSEEVKNFGEE